MKNYIVTKKVLRRLWVVDEVTLLSESGLKARLPLCLLNKDDVIEVDNKIFIITELRDDSIIECEPAVNVDIVMHDDEEQKQGVEFDIAVQ